MFGWIKGKRNVTTPAGKPNLGPPGEAEIAGRVKHLCWMATMSAESYAELKENGVAETDERFQYELSRYKKLLMEAVTLTDSISDDFYRSSAIHFMIDVCMAAKEVSQARALFRHVKVDMIQDKILEDYPTLRHEPLSDALR